MANRIEQVLQQRDNLTEDQAKKHVEYVRELIHDAIENADFGEVEDIMYCELGLEMDYVFDLI